MNKTLVINTIHDNADGFHQMEYISAQGTHMVSMKVGSKMELDDFKRQIDYSFCRVPSDKIVLMQEKGNVFNAEIHDYVREEIMDYGRDAVLETVSV